MASYIATRTRAIRNRLAGMTTVAAILLAAAFVPDVLAGAQVNKDADVTRGTSDLAIEVQKILSEHSRWVDSNGATGSRAELREEDLSRLDLSGIYLNGADLRGCNLAFSNVSNGVFLLTDLSGANLEQVNARRADFTGANLSEACLRGARMNYAKFEAMDLKGPDGKPLGRRASSNLSRADLRDADFTGALLQDAVLTDANVEGVKIKLPD